jgi:polynucleotide 5'-hydroxyl-kinase GRC3/NOL9
MAKPKKFLSSKVKNEKVPKKKLNKIHKNKKACEAKKLKVSGKLPVKKSDLIKKTNGWDQQVKKEPKEEKVSSSDSDSDNSEYIDKFFDTPGTSKHSDFNQEASSSHESDDFDDSDVLSDDCLIDSRHKKEKLKRLSSQLMNEWDVESNSSDCAPATDNPPASPGDFAEILNECSNLKKKKERKIFNGTLKVEQDQSSESESSNQNQEEVLENGDLTNDTNQVQEVVPYQNNTNDELSDDFFDSSDENDWESYDEEEIEEEWSTDTDYSMDDDYGDYEDYNSMDSCEEEEDFYSDDDDSMHSFHEGDCCEVTSEDDHMYSTDSEDFVPDGSFVEDKLVRPGEAVIYDLKSDVELNFSDSSETQIREIPVEREDSNNSCPQLIPLTETPDTLDFKNKIPKHQDYQDNYKSSQIPTVSDPDSSKFEEVPEYQEGSPISEENQEDSILESQENLPNSRNVNELPDSGDLRKSAVFYNCRQQSNVVLKLNTTIHFNGILVIKPLINNVEINGYEFKDQESITASSISHTDFYLNLTPVIVENEDKESVVKNARNFLKNRMSLEKLEEIFKDLNYQRDVLLFLEPGDMNSAIQMLQHFANTSRFVLPLKTQLLERSQFPVSELILRTKFFANINRPFGFYRKNPQWDNLEFSDNSKIVVAGGKNVGKSTLSQYLINRNVNKFGKVLLIDLDIGQPICALPQTVSATLIEGRGIFGRGCLNDHVKNPPDKCILYGDKSVMISPFRYVRCVQELFDYCEKNEKFQNVPWIINTMGYHKGFGLQLMCLLCRMIQPSDFVMIQHKVRSFNFQKIITEQLVNKFELPMFQGLGLRGIDEDCFFTTHVLDSIVNPESSKNFVSNATEKRKLMMLAHLSRILTENYVCLNDVRPFW